MRNEKEMYDLILSYAYHHEDIRVVVLNGSRANPQRIKDPFNDYDIVYLVKDINEYKHSTIFKDFGELLVYERTDENELFEEHLPDFVCYLMQFKDGNRIDLTIAEIKDYRRYCFDDHLAVVLLDKDQKIEKLPVPDESTHYLKRPSERMFQECRKEFFWVPPYVAKGLWRNQILYAQTHMEQCIRKMLLLMLGWYVGCISGFDQSIGKCGDRLVNGLPQDIWKRYLDTYALCHFEDVWLALENACGLFTEVSYEVAKSLNFKIINQYDIEVPAYLNYIKTLSKNAKTMDLTTVFRKDG